MLSCMQDLRHLYLNDALPSAAGFLSSRAFHTSQKIYLPRLSRLFISDSVSSVIALLSCVNISLKPQVLVQCHSKDNPSLDDYARLSSLLTQPFHTSDDRASSDVTIRSLVTKLKDHMAMLTSSAYDCDVSVPGPRTGFATLLFCTSSFIFVDR